MDGSTLDSGFAEASGDETPQQRWLAYIEDESMKLCLHALFFLDFQIFSPCNMRPVLSPLELGWELPLPAALWDADSAFEWLEKLEIECCVTGLQKEDDHPTIAYPCPATKSLTLAMQSLMSSSPSPYLLAALSASPMALLFVVNNIDALLKDFTRSYYQLPPNLTDPSAFHILTQSQNRQFSTALGLIFGIVENNEARDMPTSSASGAIWTTIDRISLATKLALCKPDSLLISGIVENSVTAGLATATHLALGLYAGARRSLQSLLKLAAGEDTVLVMLDELSGALQAMTHGDRRMALSEAPWTVVAEYRILLEIWRSLKWSSAEIQSRSGNRNENGSQSRPLRRAEPPVLVYNAIAEAILGFGENSAAGRHSVGARSGVLVAPPDLTESCFTKAIVQFWHDRGVWDLGKSMGNIVEDLIAADSPAMVHLISGEASTARRPSNRSMTDGEH
ncbi:hypothetical protein F5X68DRAFT_262481 [Plectosphaerella plurivora]|uniref:Uncharacterized protein n=1 Tax=Plectosphaerella plurivora TaxID=936078 RepID=A0A9P8VB18_9PEZI|nr:hypothetical protein F5X68DRAFT_262481 [Plectosphaerella plurivora]